MTLTLSRDQFYNNLLIGFLSEGITLSEARLMAAAKTSFVYCDLVDAAEDRKDDKEGELYR